MGRGAAALLWAGLALGCQRQPAPTPPEGGGDRTHTATSAAPSPAPERTPEATWSAPDWAATHAAEAGCADCHPDEVEAWQRGAMGRSLAPLTPQSPPPAGVPAHRVHPVDGHTWSVAHRPGLGLQFAIQGDGFVTRRTAAYAVGSGTHTRSYLWQRAGALFMAPLTWYARPKAWDLSPGYAVHDQPGFDRLVQADCLACHADPPAQDPDRPHRWLGPVPGAIGCARCHGDARDHAAARADGRAGPPLVNPARLPPDRANAVCEGCHLQGVVRLTRAGRPWASFRPGDRLEDHVAVFVRQAAGADFGIASHGARLRHSACRAPGGAPLTCVTCHHPHPTGAQAGADRSAPCRGCHGADSAAHGPACAGGGGTDCVRCHMRVAAVDDIPHVSVTDHFIRRSAEHSLPAVPADAPLVWVADPQEAPTDPAHQRLLGRAYADAVRAEGRPTDLARAQRLLAAGLAAQPNDLEALVAQAFVATIARDGTTLAAALDRAERLAPTDARVAEQVVALRTAQGRLDEALALSTAALARHPDVPQLHVQAAQVHRARGDHAAALAAAQAALALRPDWGSAWLAVAKAQLATGDGVQARATLGQGTAHDPSHTATWLAWGQLALRASDLKAAAQAFAGATRYAAPQDALALATAAAGQARVALAAEDLDAAAGHFQRAVAAGAPVPGLLAVTGAMALARARPADARRALEAHLQADPSDPLAWRDLARALDALGERSAAAAARDRAAALP
ncbi:MAG: tetratricopeptide repeat protein [Myxococcales bacterium]|nr:tetratricopeptide repeat protein [Myxococcales bacterium]